MDTCRVEPDGIVHHGWSCPEATPMADILAGLVGEPLANPILEQSRQKLIGFWTTGEE